MKKYLYAMFALGLFLMVGCEKQPMDEYAPNKHLFVGKPETSDNEAKCALSKNNKGSNNERNLIEDGPDIIRDTTDEFDSHSVEKGKN